MVEIKGCNLPDVFETPVQFTVANTMKDYHNATCHYWNTSQREWRTNGMETHRAANGSITCRSHHLTSFAVLMVRFCHATFIFFAAEKGNVLLLHCTCFAHPSAHLLRQSSF